MDTGPDECWPMLQERLARIPPDADGKRHVDLVVISHIDHDHIGAAGPLFSDRALNLHFGDVWFNAPPPKAPTSVARGVVEGQSLAMLLGALDRPLPWNAAFGGEHIVTPATDLFLELPAPPGQPKITLLSPVRRHLSRLFRVWDRELEALHRKEAAEAADPPPMARGVPSPDPQALAAKVTPLDRAPANGSSIAFLLEHDGASLLLAADAYASVLVPALESLARHREVPGALTLDAFKLSHHGSRANVTSALFKAVQATHYIVSTNGAMFDHPDDEAISRVIVHGGHRPRLWFNFDNVRSRRWTDPDLQRRFGHEVILPGEGEAGVTLQLGAAGK